MTQPLQLIILTPGFPINEQDTSCIPALQDFVLGWKENFPEDTIRIIAFQYPHTSQSYSWHSIPVYAAGGHDKTGGYKLITWMKIFLQLLLWKGSFKNWYFTFHWRGTTGEEKKKQSVVLSYFLTEASYVGQLFSRFSSVRHIAIAAGQDVKKSNPYLQRLNFKKLTVVVFTRKMYEELLISTGKKAEAIIPMGVLHKTAIDATTVERPIDILIAGSLIVLKQVDIAIRIIATVKKEFSNLKVEIVGKGSERPMLAQLVNELQLHDQIKFNGALTREEVREKMMQSKVLLHTSGYEGQSTVISEALEAGMYVICFDVGRITDHEKIKVCAEQTDMVHALKEILTLHNPDFSPVELFSMSETVKAYKKFMDC
ncbi:MAG: glycosyltransferase [Chitinophagales bacterium]